MDLRDAKDPLHLRHWFELAAAIVARGEADYFADELAQEAGDSLILKVGEASKHIAAHGRLDAAGVRWSDAARARDIIAHRYDTTDRDITWGILSRRFAEWNSALALLFAEAEATLEQGPSAGA